MPDYIYNSEHKNEVRQKWVCFLRQVIEGEERDEEDGVNLITFPAEEFQDLRLFSEQGLIEFEDTESGDLRLTKGKVTCFESRTKIWKSLRKTLVNVNVERTKFETYITNQFQSLRNGKISLFPVDAINLDYDGNISKQSIPITTTISHIFSLQANHEKNFCLFLTWPKPHDPQSDQPGFLDTLKRVINDNLTDPNATEFATRFNQQFQSIDDIDYDFTSFVGLTKQIIQTSTSNRYQLIENEFFFYGEEERQKMFSVLYYFEFVGDGKPTHQIYSEDVGKSLIEVQDLTN